MRSFSATWWIGINDVQNEGIFVYESSWRPITFTPKWSKDFGSHRGDCISNIDPGSGIFGSGSSEIVEWMDSSCSSYLYSICERSV